MLLQVAKAEGMAGFHRGFRAVLSHVNLQLPCALGRPC